jgi:tRNA (guanine-N7-)-methyltransferase
MRLRKIKNAREKLETFKNIVLFNPEELKGNWKTFFGKDNPIHLEIGMGKGKFILEHARKYPDINFLGLEISESVVLQAARKIAANRPKNLFLLQTDANNLTEIFGFGEVDKIYLNFSDPWPKSRHEKRRLTSEGFLDVYREILTKTGEIEFKTDNRQLFEYSLISFNNHQLKFLKVNLNLHENKDEDIITTEYEDKFKEKGNLIYYIKVVK